MLQTKMTPTKISSALLIFSPQLPDPPNLVTVLYRTEHRSLKNSCTAQDYVSPYLCRSITEKRGYSESA